MSHYNVLFLCTGNSARSILAEGLLNHKGKGKFTAFSAGSHPSGTPRPEALAQLASAGISIEGLRSKSWDEFSAPGAPQLDFVFTVCDNAANEQCPYWPGQPMTAHWGIADPAAVKGTPEEIARAFRELPVPVIGRMQDGALIFDLRCLEDETAFVDQLPVFNLQGVRTK